jgi:hypothetical protein
MYRAVMGRRTERCSRSSTSYDHIPNTQYGRQPCIFSIRMQNAQNHNDRHYNGSIAASSRLGVDTCSCKHLTADSGVVPATHSEAWPTLSDNTRPTFML